MSQEGRSLYRKGVLYNTELEVNEALVMSRRTDLNLAEDKDLQVVELRITSLLKDISKAKSFSAKTKSDNGKVMVPFLTLMSHLKQILARCTIYENLRRERGTKPIVDLPEEALARITDQTICAALTVYQTLQQPGTTKDANSIDSPQLIKVASICTHALYYEFLRPMQP